MFRLPLAVAALAAALPFAGAAASPLRSEEIRARSEGGEFRGFGRTRRSHLEDVVWRFRADGTVRSVSLVVRGYGGGMGTVQSIEYSDAGTWRVEGGRLCVQFGAVHADLSGCYGIEADARGQVRLTGPVTFQGTLSR